MQSFPGAGLVVVKFREGSGQEVGPEVFMVTLKEWLRPPGFWESCE